MIIFIVFGYHVLNDVVPFWPKNDVNKNFPYIYMYAYIINILSCDGQYSCRIVPRTVDFFFVSCVGWLFGSV